MHARVRTQWWCSHILNKVVPHFKTVSRLYLKAYIVKMLKKGILRVILRLEILTSAEWTNGSAVFEQKLFLYPEGTLSR